MSEIALEVATDSSAALLGNLLQLYIHDLSEVFPLELGADGRYAYDRLPLYWSRPETHFAFLIRARTRVAGFALVTRGSPASDDPDALDLTEFFVLRSYRRSGVGRVAAPLVWDRLPGQWVVRVAEANRAGVPFWESTVREYTGGAFSAKPFQGRNGLFRAFSFASRSG